MKVLIVLALVAVAFAWPMRRGGGGRDGGPNGAGTGGMMGGGDGGEGGFGPGDGGEGMEEIKPVTRDDALGLLGDAREFATAVRGHFQDLKDHADSITGDEESLGGLAEHVGALVEGLKTKGQEGVEELSGKWMHGMARLAFAGVEGEGQCHKVLEFLIKAMHEAEANEREMHPDELKFWQGVAMAAKAEVGCIIRRFDKFVGLIDMDAEMIKNDNGEEGRAFEAEVGMGGLAFGFGHMYRQITVFVHVMDALLNYEKEEADQQRGGELRELLRQTMMIKRRMDQMKGFEKYRK